MRHGKPPRARAACQAHDVTDKRCKERQHGQATQQRIYNYSALCQALQLCSGPFVSRAEPERQQCFHRCVAHMSRTSRDSADAGARAGRARSRSRAGHRGGCRSTGRKAEHQEGRQDRHHQHRPDQPEPQARGDAALNSLCASLASACRDATKGPPGRADGTSPRSTRPARHARLRRPPWPTEAIPARETLPSIPQMAARTLPKPAPRGKAVARPVDHAIRTACPPKPWRRRALGQVAEWFKAHAWKACVV